MEHKVEKYIYNNKLLERNDKVLVALSGGPDSVCLLYILYKLKDSLGIKLGAVHINHMLRGEEANDDSLYTKNLCKKLGIKYYVREVDISRIAREEGISLEVCGREERYKAFKEIKEKEDYTKIAVAHNANDQAETILMRMMRGTGLEGLIGITAKRDDGIIRPILCLDRSEIEKYCEVNQLSPRIDKSNYERIYNRNKVRLDILPYMKNNFNEDIVNTLNRMATLLQKDNEFIEQYCIKQYADYCKRYNEGIKIKKQLFIDESEAIFTRIVKMAFKNISSSYQNFEMKHIYDIVGLVKKNSGKQIHLTNNIIAENVYGDVLLKQRQSVKGEKLNVSFEKDDIPNCVEILDYKVLFEVLSEKNNIKFSNNHLIKYFDYDKIEKRIVIRNRIAGDKMIPLGMNNNKKVKDILINSKVPREDRDNIPVLCFDDKISWLVGIKTSQDFRITNETKKVLKITFKKEIVNE